MNWIDDTIRDFGRGMGMELALDERGVLQLAFERMGTLGFERAKEGVLVYLRRLLEHPGADTYRRALQVCHYSENPLFPVQPALQADGGLLFAIYVPAADFQMPTLERAVAFLDLLHNEVQ